MFLEERQLRAEVDHPRVDRVRNGKVDQFAENWKWRKVNDCFLTVLTVFFTPFHSFDSFDCFDENKF